jgi:hypothetical protein
MKIKMLEESLLIFHQLNFSSFSSRFTFWLHFGFTQWVVHVQAQIT